MPVIRLRSPLARAVVPVVGGALLLGAILGVTWVVAIWLSRGGAESSERLAPTTFGVGRVEAVSDEIAESGPLLFGNLDDSTAERVVVLDHQGDDPTEGWRVAWGYPADVGPLCHVDQVEGTDRFVDCTGREIAFEDLATDEALCPIVESRKELSIGLRPNVCGVAR